MYTRYRRGAGKIFLLLSLLFLIWANMNGRRAEIDKIHLFLDSIVFALIGIGLMLSHHCCDKHRCDDKHHDHK